MNNVSSNNFNDLYPEIKKVLTGASFVAFDMEFSGIRSPGVECESLFDSPDERYQKLRDHIEPFIVLQFGLTAFTKVESTFQITNIYKSSTYNFHLMPRSIPTRNRTFSMQVSALEFLASNSFDFNVNANCGISYLNEEDEEYLLKLTNDKSFLSIVKKLSSYKEDDDIREIRSKVYEWMSKLKEKQSISIPVPNSALNYLIHKDIRHHFPNVWTVNGNDCIHVIKTSEAARQELEFKEGQVLENAFFQFHVGFSKVFKLLIALQKPMIGHNILLDLMFMHHQFYRSLPKKYADFKQSINKIFPILYDTKCMHMEFKNMCKPHEQPKSSSLDGLCQYFETGAGRNLGLNSPHLMKGCDPKTIKDKAALHHAGYDSYFAGYIFLKMSYVFALKKYGRGVEMREMTQTELVSCLSELVNRVYLNRGNVPYLRLDGPEVTTLQNLLCVHILKPDEITESQILEQFSEYGAVDVRRISRKRAMVAVGVSKTAADIVRKFRMSNTLRVYHTGLNSSVGRKYYVWSGLLFSSGIIGWMWRRHWVHFLKRT